MLKPPHKIDLEAQEKEGAHADAHLRKPAVLLQLGGLNWRELEHLKFPEIFPTKELKEMLIYDFKT